MAKRQKTRLRAVLILTMGFAASCSDGIEPDARIPLSYVGSPTCKNCHPMEHDLWSSSHHDLAMAEATSESVRGDFSDAQIEHFGVTSSFHHEGSRFLVTTEGEEGDTQTYDVAYVFGDSPLQQYLVRFPEGRLQALPLAFDTRPREDGGQRWFHLYPDEHITPDDALFWTGPLQNWNFMCAECHSTDLSKGYLEENRSYKTSFAEIDVACEACHGPGSRHVAWARKGAKAGESLGLQNILGDRDNGIWVMNDDTGTAARVPPRTRQAELETCAPCHSRRSVVASGRTPGDPFLDHYRPSLLEAGLYHANGRIRDEVYVYGSFLQSKMYHAGVTCHDCHNPHSLELALPGNKLCIRCHDAGRFDTPVHHHHSEGSPGAACVDCHMPVETYMVVDPRRDHGFRIPRPDLSAKYRIPNACNDCHQDQSSQWAANAIDSWRTDASAPEKSSHFTDALHAARYGTPNAGQQLIDLVLNRDAPGIVRATAAAHLRDHPIPATLDALAQATTDEDPLVRYGAAISLDILPDEPRTALGIPLLGDALRLVRIEAARQLASTRTNLDPETRALLESGLTEFRDAQHVNADRPESHLNLGVLAAQLGEVPEAEREYGIALDLDRRFVQAAVNLADLYRSTGQEEDAMRVLNEARDAVPGAAPVHHAIGLALVRAGEKVRAAQALARAAELAPNVPRFSFVYAICLQEVGETNLALQVLRESNRRHPTDTDILSALTTLSLEQGDVTAARQFAEAYLRLRPNDPGMSAFLRSLDTNEKK